MQLEAACSSRPYCICKILHSSQLIFLLIPCRPIVIPGPEGESFWGKNSFVEFVSWVSCWVVLKKQGSIEFFIKFDTLKLKGSSYSQSATKFFNRNSSWKKWSRFSKIQSLQNWGVRQYFESWYLLSEFQMIFMPFSKFLDQFWNNFDIGCNQGCQWQITRHMCLLKYGFCNKVISEKWNSDQLTTFTTY